MGVDRKKLEAIIGGRARAMCTPEFDKTLNEYAGKSNLGHNYDPDPAMYDADGDMFDRMYSSTFTKSNNNSGDMQYTNEAISKSNMPDIIKQSMLAERIDVTGTGGISVLDSMNIQVPMQNRKQINETKPQRNIQTTLSQPVNPSIDYTIIKAIVNECLNEYFSKQSLNESVNVKTIGLKDGYISLVDNKGNIFKAKLEKVGNKNDKK